MIKIFNVFYMVRVYKENVLVITKNQFLEQLKALDKILHKLAELGLNVNAEN